MKIDQSYSEKSRESNENIFSLYKHSPQVLELITDFEAIPVE